MKGSSRSLRSTKRRLAVVAVPAAILILGWSASVWRTVVWNGVDTRIVFGGGAIDVLRQQSWQMNLDRPQRSGLWVVPSNSGRQMLKWWPRCGAEAGGWWFTMPLWLPTVVAVGAAVMCARSYVRARRCDGAACPGCGYDRSGLATGSVCPECGVKGAVNEVPQD